MGGVFECMDPQVGSIGFAIALLDGCGTTSGAGVGANVQIAVG